MTAKSPLGQTTNEEYIAAKLARKAYLEKQAADARALRGTPDDPFRFNPRFNPDMAYYTDADGNFGLGLRPEGGLYYNDYSGSMVTIPPPPVEPHTGPLSLGGPPGGGYQGGSANPGSGGPYLNPFDPPPNYNPNGGNGQPNGGIPPGYLGYGGGTNENFGQGGGAVSGPQQIDWGSLNDALRPPLEGFEASTNKDLYQNQFADLRRDQNAYGLRALAAAVRGQDAQNNPSPAQDPWAWANLPEVRHGTGGVDAPISYQINPRYGWDDTTSNQQVVQDLNLSAAEMAALQKHPQRWEDAPSVFDRNAFQEFITVNPNDKAWTNALNKVFQATWTPVQGTEGPTVPVGYASPVNATGAG